MSKYLKTREGSLEDLVAGVTEGKQSEDYKQLFKKELEKAGKGIGAMSDQEKKVFFNKIDKMHTAKNEEPKADKMNKQQMSVKGESVELEEGGVKDFLMDVEDDASDMSLNDLIKKYYGQMGLTAQEIKKIYYRVNESVEVTEGNISKVHVKKSGTDFDVYYRGRTKYGNNKMIGYFFKTGANRFSAYFDNENDDDDFLGSAEFNNKNDAIKTIFDYANGNGVIKEESEEKEEVKSLRDTVHDIWNQAASEEEKREDDAKWLKTEEKKSLSEVDSKIKCPACGHMNKMDAEKCVNCGASLTQKSRPANNRREEKKGKEKTMVGTPVDKVDPNPEVEFDK